MSTSLTSPLPGGVTSRTPAITVVIATCANAARTLRCLRSIFATGYADLDVVVAENRPAASPVRAAIAESFPGDPRVVVTDVWRPGLSHARNAGLALAGAPIVAFIDDDIVVDPRWLHTLAAAFTASGADCVTGRISPTRLDTPAAELFEQLAALGKGDAPRTFSLRGPQRHNRLFPYAAGAMGSGANIAVRTDVGRRLGGFDPRLGAGTATAGGEDLDFFIRLILGGHKVHYSPSAIVYHEHPASMRQVRRRAFTYGAGLTAMLAGQLVAGPRRRLLRAIPVGLRYVLDPASRKNVGRDSRYPGRLVWLERLGMALGPLLWLLSARAQGPRGAMTAAPRALAPEAPFVPAVGRSIDLELPLTDLELGRSCTGARYEALIALLRVRGAPVLATEIPVPGGAISADGLARQLVGALGPGLNEQLRALARPDAPELTAEQLRSGLGALDRELAAAEPHWPFATVVVPTARRAARIHPLLESLLAMDYPEFEVLIVDNGPDDRRTREEVMRFVDRGAPVRYAVEPLPGSSVARNRGVRECRSDVIAFTDDDVAVDPGWLKAMIRPFLDDHRVGVVTGLVMPARYDTPQQRLFEELSGFGKGFDRCVYDRTSGQGRHLLYPYWGAVFGSGNSMAFRREVYEEIGGLDPALGAGSPAKAGADIESFSHAVLRGHRLVYEPRAVCWHDHRTTRAALRRQTFNYGAGCTAILTKWMFKDRRLVSLTARQAGALAWSRLVRGAGATGLPPEITRLSHQMTATRADGTAGRQMAGFAAGPVLYARSLLYTRRRRLRDVLPATAQDR